MPVQGLVRLRRHQLSRQSTFGNTIPATRAFPFQGVPSVDLAWTDPEIDSGSRDPVAAPYRGAPDLTFPVTIPSLGYNTLTAILCGFFGGQEIPTGGGTAKTWTHEPASTTIDEPDVFTYEFGDDVVTDWYQFGDALVEEFEITAPVGLGALSATATWRLGSVASTGSTDSPVDGTVPTPGLDLDPNEVLIYLKDMGIYIADTEAGLGAGQVTDALHSFVFGGSQEIDQKRYANGDQSFDIDAYGPGARTMHLMATWAKTADTVGVGSESDDWMSDTAVTRYVRLLFVSTALAQAPSTFYGWTLTMPLRYYTREDGNEGGNTTVILDGNLFYDPEDFEGELTSVLVNTLTEADLGTVAS
jgi:hypothetical protein